MKIRVLNKGKSAEVLLYEDIGEGWFGGISAKRFAEEIKKLGAVEQIDLRINSPGGNVFDGVAMYNLLASHRAKVVTYVDGLAASIASVIAMAGDEIYMADNALMMIHDPWSITAGSADDLRREAEVLDTVKDQLVKTYAKRTGNPEDRVAELMAEETWMDSATATALGFADVVEAELAAAAYADVSRCAKHFKHIPDQVRAAQEKETAAASNNFERNQYRDRIAQRAAVAKQIVPRDVQRRHAANRKTASDGGNS